MLLLSRSGLIFGDCISAQVKTWHQEHREMINSSTTWMAEAQQWLAAPCTYTTAKCLSSHVQALRVGRHKKKDFSFFFLFYFNE